MTPGTHPSDMAFVCKADAKNADTQQRKRTWLKQPKTESLCHSSDAELDEELVEDEQLDSELLSELPSN